MRDRVLYSLFFIAVMVVCVAFFVLALLVDCGLSVRRRVA